MDSLPGVTTRLVGPAEIATMLGGLSRQRVYQLTTRDDFPPPLATLATGHVWSCDDVHTWAHRAGRTTHPLPDQ